MRAPGDDGFVAGTEPKEACGPRATRRASRRRGPSRPCCRLPPPSRRRHRRAPPPPRPRRRPRTAVHERAARHSPYGARSARPARPGRSAHAAAARAGRRSPRRAASAVHADLLHRVAVPDRHLAVGRLALVGVAHRLHVHRHAVRRAHLVLAPVEPADRGGVVVDRGACRGPARRGWPARCARSRRAS